ncbi:Deleted in malignant brain tumors 1 protein [Labeo rohita]|uniref:Deleted in malignant brain tumors 1 protein n=1 Tax=Labeo rohita TaxID=84645 RepID=A0ABQ8L4Y0_LABRO|nr:Deleted in malignant brain tumors 1 protein [Labeo rohita]
MCLSKFHEVRRFLLTRFLPINCLKVDSNSYNIRNQNCITEHTLMLNLQQPNISHSAPDGWFVVGSQGPVITRGHSFTIICSTESQYPGGSFHLFRGSNITRSESAVNHSSSFSFPEADYSHEGNYSCVYEVSVSSRSFRSSASELLLITITGLRLVSGSDSCCGRVEVRYNGQWGTVCDDDWDMNDTAVVCRQLQCGSAISATHSATFGQGSGSIWLDDVECSGSEGTLTQCSHRGLGKHDCNHGKDAGVVCSGEVQMPTLSLTSTYVVVSHGENIQFRCTTPKPRCNVNAEFQLFRNGLSVSSQTHVSSVTFNHNVDVSHQGTYSCQYSYQNNIKSPLSNTVIITVGDLQQPSILHSAPDGQFVVGSQGPVITRGHSFTIICSTESQYPGGSFHLFRGSDITRSESAVNHSASFFFPEADYSHEGNYSCVYEVSVSSRSFRSSASELLLITITASLLPVIGAAVSAVLLLLSVLIVIVILLLKRRQKQRNTESKMKSSFRKGAANSCAGASNQKRGNKKNENHEADYENLEFNDKNVDLETKSVRPALQPDGPRLFYVPRAGLRANFHVIVQTRDWLRASKRPARKAFSVSVSSSERAFSAAGTVPRSSARNRLKLATKHRQNTSTSVQPGVGMANCSNCSVADSGDD